MLNCGIFSYFTEISLIRFGEKKYLQVSLIYVVGSKGFGPDQLFKVTEIKQFCYFST